MNKCIINSANLIKALLLATLLIATTFAVAGFLLGYVFCTVTGIYPPIQATSEIGYFLNVGIINLTTLIIGFTLVTLLFMAYDKIVDAYRDAKYYCDVNKLEG